MTKACTSVFTYSTSSERRTRLSWRSQKKTLKSHTRWRRACPAATVSVPSCSDGPPLPNGACPYLEPTQTSSVFSLFSLSLLADIQRLTSVRQCSSLVAANAISSRKHFKYSCVSSAYACKFISCFSTTSARSGVYEMKRRGPSTEPCGTHRTEHVVHVNR